MAAVVDTFVWAIETSNPNWRFAATKGVASVRIDGAGGLLYAVRRVKPEPIFALRPRPQRLPA